MHGPDPATASQPRSLLNYFRPSQATASSSASGAAQPPSTLQRPSFIDSDLLARNAAILARANNPAITNPASPPHTMFNLYDDDYESVHSDEDGGLGADVTAALDQNSTVRSGETCKYSTAGTCSFGFCSITNITYCTC